MFATRLWVTVTQKKAVRLIERAYIRYRDRLRSTLTKEQQSINLRDTYMLNIHMIIKIQRYFRKRLAHRFTHGKKLVKRKELYHRIHQQWQQERYRQTASFEGKLL
jgi:hypothetical protein